VKPPARRSILIEMRRILLALTVSLAVHLGAVAVAAGVGLWRTLSLVPSVKMQPIAIDVVKDLPLGAAPDKQPVAADEPPVRVRKPRVRVPSARDGVTVPSAPDAGAPEPKSDAGVVAKTAPHDGGGSIDGGRRRPGDLRSNGPEGSRLIALLRLDRLRASPDSESTMLAVDRLLVQLPDRHRLIDGTGLDLYRDFDSLLIATPNPTDDAVTFLAARHHLMDVPFKAALDRGARAAKKPITWRTIEGRPVGIRQQDKGAGAVDRGDRDDRILALPMPALAIMAPPAYAAQLLGRDVLAPPISAGRIDAGSADAKASGGETRKAAGRPNWREIAARIEAEDSAMPDDAAFMMTASNLFVAPGSESVVVPSTRGANDDSPPSPVGGDAGPPPQSLTLVVGAETPFIEILAEFKTAAEADWWEHDLPAWKRRIVTNPAVLLTGFSSLVSRAQFSREGNTLRTRIEVSTAELQRLLNLVGNLTRTALARMHTP
jgi:hypothetical protein